MGSILYLLRKNIKNGIVDTFRHPLKLIVYGLIAASLVYAVIRSFTMDIDVEDMLDFRILYGAYLALLFFISIPIMLKGLSTGSTFFTMGDVNNIFVAPISPKKILVYGIGKQLATSLFLVVCFSAYGSMAIKMFDITTGGAFILVLGIALMLLIVQISTLLIFCLCSSKPSLCKFFKLFIYSLAFLALGTVAAFMFSTEMTIENLYTAVSQQYLEYIPIIGWVHGIVFGLISGNTAKVILYSSLLFILCMIGIIVFHFTKLDYFEDVLSKAENYFEFRNNLRSGTVSDKMFLGSKKIRIRNKGIHKGEGASAIFYKHLREGSRRSRFMMFNINTVVLIVITSIIGLVMKNFFYHFWDITYIYISAVIICSYIQFFFSAAGDWVKELNKPYIFLIPDSSVKKLIMASATSIIKPFCDGIIAFFFLWLLVRGSALDAINCAFAYGSFGCIYISSNILAQRIVGISGNRGVFITFYMGIMVALMVPGILMGFYLLSMLTWQYRLIATTFICIPIIFWNIFISFMIFLMCKNLLNNIE